MLPSIFKPKKQFKLIRLGKAEDGGYLVGKDSVKNSNFLLSFGISDDWNFEKDFIKSNKVKFLCFDDHISVKFFLKRIFYKIFFFPFIQEKKSLFKEIFKLIDFIKFFDRTRLIIKKISYGSLEQILSEINNKNIFLKVDIEGYEYRILDEILKYQDYFSGCVIEFHDVDLHEPRISNFIKNFDLELVHIHGNNYSQIYMHNPTVLELTFDKYPLLESEVNVLPNPLDKPNNPSNKESKLHFK